MVGGTLLTIAMGLVAVYTSYVSVKTRLRLALIAGYRPG
jgi:hypothetical protein